MRVAELAKQLFQVRLVRVWVAVQAQKIDGAVGWGRREGGPVSVLICVEEDVRSVVFVVAVSQLVSYVLPIAEAGWTYSRAQRYGASARMLGRAQVCRLKGDIVRWDGDGEVEQTAGLQVSIIYGGAETPRDRCQEYDEVGVPPLSLDRNSIICQPDIITCLSIPIAYRLENTHNSGHWSPPAIDQEHLLTSYSTQTHQSPS